MSDLEKVAELLFRAEQGPNEFPYSPYGRRSRLSDLWPSDQDKYYRMAEVLIATGYRPDAP